MKQRAFADSNILFSASYRSGNDFARFWHLPDVEILTSQYSIAEVSRNLRTPEQRARLWQLIYLSHLVPDGDGFSLSPEIMLPEKDRPILRSAIAGGAHILITGDTAHFGRYVGQVLQGVLIQKPADFSVRHQQPPRRANEP